MLRSMIETKITFEGVDEPKIFLHILKENDEYFQIIYIVSWY